MKVGEIILRKLDLSPIKPYKVSYRSYTSFDPFIVEVLDEDGNVGWGEGLISPGSSEETQEGGWKFLCEHAEQGVGKTTNLAKSVVEKHKHSSPIAAAALATAIEMSPS